MLILITLAMYFMGSQYYHKVRKAVGLPYMQGNKNYPAVEPDSSEVIEALLKTGRAALLAVIGFGGVAIIAFLMIFKPF